MKLLLDQNLSPRLAQKFKSKGVQVRGLKLENASDITIWDHAKKNSYTVVTADSDFSDLAILRGVPPRIILLRYGNTSTDGHFSKITSYTSEIETFIESPDSSERILVLR